MASVAITWLSVQDYLEAERRAAPKSEYWAGDVFAMAGGSAEHSLIKSTSLRARRPLTPASRG